MSQALTEAAPVAAVRVNPTREVGQSIYDEWRSVLAPAYETIALDGGRQFCAYNTAFTVDELILIDGFISGGLYKRDRSHVGKTEEFVWLQQFSSGEERIQVGEDAYILQAGMLCFCDGRYPSLCASGPIELRNVLIPARMLPWWDCRPTQARYHALDTESPVGRVLADALDELYETSRTAPSVIAHAAARNFVGLMNDLMDNNRRRRQSRRVQDALANSMQRYLIQNLDNPDLGVDDLCLTFFCSRSKVYRVFESVGGIHRFLREHRLLRCCDVLANTSQQERTIRAVAEHWGFDNPSHFNRLFKRAFGLAPSEVRATNIGIHQGVRLQPEQYRDVHAWV